MPRRPRSTRALCCTGLALICAIAAPAAQGAGAAASFSIRPGHYDENDPASRAYFKRSVAPGASFSDDVVVSNGGSTPVTLLVYPVDGLTGQTSMADVDRTALQTEGVAFSRSSACSA